MRGTFAYGAFAEEVKVEEGDPFVPRYLELLSAGGSRSPEELGTMIGIDLADPGFWNSGLALVEQQLTEAEKLTVPDRIPVAPMTGRSGSDANATDEL